MHCIIYIYNIQYTIYTILCIIYIYITIIYIYTEQLLILNIIKKRSTLCEILLKKWTRRGHPPKLNSIGTGLHMRIASPSTIAYVIRRPRWPYGAWPSPHPTKMISY